MSNRKAFFIGLFATLALILPVYFIFAAISFSGKNAAAADNKQSNVPIAHPSAADAKTVLIIEDNKTSAVFALVRFDALENKIVTSSLLSETVVLADGKGLTLIDALRTAGPAQAVKSISETLGITVDDYIMASPDTLAQMWQPLGIAQVLLANYINAETMSQLKLAVPGIEDVALSPLRFKEILHSEFISRQSLCVLCADGYLAFLRANSDVLDTVLVNAFKKSINSVQTDISAADIFDYERILKFLVRGECEFASAQFDGQMSNERFELAENTPQTAVEFFA